MTLPVQTLRFAEAREAADLAAFLGRLLHYDRAAAVRLQAGGGDALAVFGRPPSFEVLAIRTARLARPETLDVTVSAGELLETLDVPGTADADAGGALPAPRHRAALDRGPPAPGTLAGAVGAAPAGRSAGLAGDRRRRVPRPGRGPARGTPHPRRAGTHRP